MHLHAIHKRSQSHKPISSIHNSLTPYHTQATDFIIRSYTIIIRSPSKQYEHTQQQKTCTMKFVSAENFHIRNLAHHLHKTSPSSMFIDDKRKKPSPVHPTISTTLSYPHLLPKPTNVKVGQRYGCKCLLTKLDAATPVADEWVRPLAEPVSFVKTAALLPVLQARKTGIC